MARVPFGTPPTAAPTRTRAQRLVALVVFSAAGTLSMFVTRALLHGLGGIEGSLWSGPWSYRAAYLMVGPPVYSALLLLLGTMVGQRSYFAHRLLKVWGRLLPRRR